MAQIRAMHLKPHQEFRLKNSAGLMEGPWRVAKEVNPAGKQIAIVDETGKVEVIDKYSMIFVR